MSQQQSTTLEDCARLSLQQAVKFSWACQQSDGHWVAPVHSDATFTAQYVMFKYAIPGLSLEADGDVLRKWLFADQNEDGSWTAAPGLPGSLSTTVEAYLALRLLDVPASHPAMERARDFVLSQGGVAQARFFTRLYLASFGLYPWSAIPQMPAELILMPTWATLNVYVLSYWARCTLIPMLIIRHHEPVYSLPNGYSPDNDFLDELWLDPSDKNVPFAPPLWDLFCGEDRDAIKWLFVAGDKLLSRIGGLKKGPQRRLARQRCIDWLLERQEDQGDWGGGAFTFIHPSIWALLLEGFPLQHKAVRLGLQALERLAITDAKGKWLQVTPSPVWDTTLMAEALCDAGLSSDARLNQAAAWLRDRQITADHGDWRVNSSTSQPGSWGFQYYNTSYPDVDDTAVVVMTLVKQNPLAIASDWVLNAVQWILGMQNKDGGWGAFDANNDARWLQKIPLGLDSDSLVDPSTPDVTGRMLECFGFLLANRKGACLPGLIQYRLRVAAKRALRCLLRDQGSEGAASGSWWGRWGNNYNYGTANVLRGLAFWCHDNPEVVQAAMRAIRWIRQCQNLDGGWGETLLSYTDPSLAGQGESTSAQTSWALESLLRYAPASDPAIRRGIQWLVSNQTVKSEHGEGMSWRTDLYAATAFPGILYMGYPYYHHIFAIKALSRYLESSEYQELQAIAPYRAVDIPPTIISQLGRRDILFVVLAGHGHIDACLSVAKRLPGHRICIAAHSAHRNVVREQGYEFSDVGNCPNKFSRIPGKQPRPLWPIANNSSHLQELLRFLLQRFQAASFDHATIPPKDANNGKGLHLRSRPFLADIVVSNPAATVHSEAEGKSRAQFVLISPRPAVLAQGGADAATDVILRQLDLLETSPCCALIPALKADWRHSLTGFLLSGAAATSLVRSQTLAWDDLQVQNGVDWNIRPQPEDGLSSTSIGLRRALVDYLIIAFATIIAMS
ncbi:terpenoid cyclases/protein prenyltransferase alpha-alpha toroid [Xylaria grammica]|nr:terpenoid cyclases/protein prenyltransferase alpha-alpha toroid [Xylaria grammica]